MKAKAAYIRNGIDDIVLSVKKLIHTGEPKVVTAYYTCSRYVGIDIITPCIGDDPIYPLVGTYYNHRHTEDIRSLCNIIQFGTYHSLYLYMKQRAEAIRKGIKDIGILLNYVGHNELRDVYYRYSANITVDILDFNKTNQVVYPPPAQTTYPVNIAAHREVDTISFLRREIYYAV